MWADDGRITFIRDTRYARYVIADAELVWYGGPTCRRATALSAGSGSSNPPFDE
jgi:hypothetical protein